MMFEVITAIFLLKFSKQYFYKFHLLYKSVILQNNTIFVLFCGSKFNYESGVSTADNELVF